MDIKDERPIDEEYDFSEALALAQELLKDPTKVRIDMKFTDLEESEEVDDEFVEKGDDGKEISDKMFLRLKMALDRVKKYYSDFRNYLTRYNLTFRSNKSGDVYLLKNKVILRVTVYSRALKVYLGLKPKEVDPKYHTVNMSDKKKYDTIPVMLRVSSDRSYKYLLELVDMLAERHKLTESNRITDIDYTVDLQSDSQELLKLLGYEDLLVKRSNTLMGDVLPNSVGRNTQILITNPNKVSGHKEVYEITVGEISAAFGTKYEVTLPLLKQVGLAPESANYLRVIARGECKTRVSVRANDYDILAVKMIVITGGNVVKYVN